jgi:hypothetical protein
MRWRSRLARSVPVVLAVVLVLTLASPAQAARRRIYEGGLGGPGGQIAFFLAKRVDATVGLRAFQFVTEEVACDDGSTQGWLVGFWWGGRARDLPDMPGHRVDLDDNDGQTAIHLHGRIQAVHGDGTLVWTLAALDADEEPMLCTTGELPWSVTRTQPPAAVATPTSQALERHRFRSASGAVVTLTRFA